MKVTFLKCRNKQAIYKLQQKMGGETWFSNSWKIPAKRRVGLKVIPNNYPTTMDHPYTASKGYSGVLLTFFQDDILNGCRCCPSSRFSRPITWQ